MPAALVSTLCPGVNLVPWCQPCATSCGHPEQQKAAHSRAGPRTEKWENLNETKFFLLSLTIKITWKKFGSLQQNWTAPSF